MADSVHVSLSVRSRPVRLGILMNGFSDNRMCRIGIKLSTALWGGMFNPFIPVLQRRPNWMDNTSLSGREVTQGYIDTFEPDLVVGDDRELLQSIDIDSGRRLHLSDIRGDDGEFVHGIPVTDVYKHLYEERYQFKRRHPERAIVSQPNPTSAPRLVQAVMGSLSDNKLVGNIRDTYEYVFDPSEVTVDETNFYELVKGRTLYPLLTGSFGLSIRRMGPSYTSRPTLFLMSGASTRDLIDYWNLRAVGRHVLPVPIEWISGAGGELAKIIEAAFEMSGESASSPFVIEAICARSLVEPSRHLDKLKSAIGLADEVRLIAVSYPRLWNRGRHKGRVSRRCIVECRTTRSDHELDPADPIMVQGPGIEVPVSEGNHMGVQWVDVVQLSNYSNLFGVASVFPPAIRETRNLVSSLASDRVWFSREGIISPARETQAARRWFLPNGYDVFKQLFEERDFETSLSPAGKSAREATERLGGLHMVGIFQNEELLTLLDGMAAGQHLVEVEDKSEIEDLPRARGRVAYRHEVMRVLKKTHDNDIQARNVLSQLTHTKSLQVGLIIECTQCDHSNWVSLEKLDEQIECERCLEKFRFPAGTPPKQQWAYRTVGPFAVENYMQGSYTVLLAILAVSQIGLSSDVTWSPSFRANKQGLREHEMDFGLLMQDGVVAGGAITTIFGECKSYWEITERDIQTANVVRRNFPDSLYCFAFLKEHLKEEEKDLLRDFVKSGWSEPGQRMAQVIVLTGKELLTRERIPRCWEEEEFSDGEKPSHPLKDCHQLSLATQRLYLDLGVEEYRRHAI